MSAGQLATTFAFSAYLVALTAWDFLRKESPWWATTPLIFGLLVVRARCGPLPAVLGGWILFTLPYLANYYGAADYRLLLVGWGLFPTLPYAITLGMGMAVLGLAALAVVRRTAPHRPTRRDLLTFGQPGLFVISLPTLVYVWFVEPLTTTPLVG
jgi:hypothetical protein